MAKAKTNNDLRQVAALATSANDKLNELYKTLGMTVTATATLNEELSELPEAKDIRELASALAQLRNELRWFVEPEWEFPAAEEIQEAVEGLGRLREELDWFVEPEWQIPDASDLQDAAEAASTLAAKLTRVDQSQG